MLKYLSTTLGIEEGQLAEMLYKKSEDGKELTDELNENALKSILDKDKERVKTLRAEGKTESFDDAYAKAKSEVLEKEEKRIIKKYKLEDADGKKIDDIISLISQNAVSAAEVKGELTDDQFKADPRYVALESDLNAKIDTLKTEHQTAITNLQNGFDSSQILGEAKSAGLKFFDSLNPILSKDTAKAGNQRTKFINFLDGYTFAKTEDEKDFIITKDGKRVEDAHGNAITLEKLVTNEATEFFDFAVQKQKSSAGNKTEEGSIAVPTNKDDYEMAMLNASTPEERVLIRDAYQASGGSTE